ncbi:hypothetical protein K1T71_005728 [Dendrolimus kikuchii]|uniref:Uncharacterized protein n=1 Tax=Dendrolimus kikuchii TaxID=765133 RepID=A0ACC1D4Y4_9NEOP|nr:hypothetical protein K1T71_005728 [Dendrolimus kikuchii]
MVVNIIIAGESKCEIFAQICLVADHLVKNLPNFCYKRIEKPVLEYRPWLCKINQKNGWHHVGSPLVWKELLMQGSKPVYIGCASEFLDYCHSYYGFESFLSTERFKGLVENMRQLEMKLNKESFITTDQGTKEPEQKNDFVISISGAGNPLTMYIISGLLEMTYNEKNVSKIYIYDNCCSKTFMEYVEKECSYIGTYHSGKVVQYVEKIGRALTHTDLFIILDHVPLDPQLSIGEWLDKNKQIISDLALHINVSASRKICVLFPNLGPACYNATVLLNETNICKANIVVATSDLGLGIVHTAAEIAKISRKSMFCPPVWGFVGINHLVDIHTTVHKYNSFEPYNRYTKVRNSTLNIGSLTPEMRTMEYLMFFDESLWNKVAENKVKPVTESVEINKAIAILNVVKLWLFELDPKQIINLGIRCNGSFGLHFPGVFSQPSRFVDGEWLPAREYMLPKDRQLKLPYLEEMAYFVMKLGKSDLAPIIPYYPCCCKPKLFKKKGVW